MSEPLAIAVEDPRLPEVIDLLQQHLALARATSPPEHVHALDLDGLQHPSVTFCGARQDGVLLAVGALRHLDDGHAEIKSMHTLAAARGRGIGMRMLQHLLARARERGYRCVSLETGTMQPFAAARRLYARAGFAVCAPFGSYTRNDYSLCMTLRL